MTKFRNLEFEIIKCKENNINKAIAEFRQKHPSYEIFNINAFGTGYTVNYCIIWRRIS